MTENYAKNFGSVADVLVNICKGLTLAGLQQSHQQFYNTTPQSLQRGARLALSFIIDAEQGL